jgi:hypothetical protein
MRGEMVIVRAFEDRPLVRRVWSADATAVFVCSEENFARLSAGQEGWMPVGFARQDVYQYDDGIAWALDDTTHANPSLWDRLHHWEGMVS